MLVRGQARIFQIIARVAQGSISATRFRWKDCKPHSRETSHPLWLANAGIKLTNVGIKLTGLDIKHAGVGANRL
jgi:hypothetical protein